MRIGVVHNYYRLRGGEDEVVDREIALLRDYGHEVSTFFRRSADQLEGASFAEKWVTAMQLPFRQDAYIAFHEYLEIERPDVVHVHNTFPLISFSVLQAARERGVPVAMTLHNFRLMCVNGLFLREGKSCEKCLHGSAIWGSAHGCYRGSVAASLPMTRLVKRYEQGRRLAPLVDRMLALSSFSRGKFLEAGIPAEKLSVKPNFCADPGDPPPWETREPFALYVGRLSEEKGVAPLLDAWKGLSVPLKLVGDGPMRPVVEATSLPGLEVLGPKTPQEVRELMRKASFLVIPSLCYENFPLVIAEACANGLPVLARRLGSLETILEESGCGRLFPSREPDGLAQAVRSMSEATEQLRDFSRRGRAAYLDRFSPQAAIGKLEGVYAEILSSRNRSKT